jgi:uncharacterized protein YwgA
VEAGQVKRIFKKLAFLCKIFLKVMMSLIFTLYHYGPFSFELREKLENMLAEGFVELDRRVGYGPQFRVTAFGNELMSKFPNALNNRKEAIDNTASFVRDRNAGELERISTALYLLLENPNASDNQIVEELVDIKPHVQPEAALVAVREIREVVSSTQ